MTVRWSISSCFHFFTQACERVHVLYLLHEIILQAAACSQQALRLRFAPTQCLLSPKYMHTITSKLVSMHVLGGLSRKKSPRAMWSSAGLLEKGVDYKFHVREFMFRCS